MEHVSVVYAEHSEHSERSERSKRHAWWGVLMANAVNTAMVPRTRFWIELGISFKQLGAGRTTELSLYLTSTISVETAAAATSATTALVQYTFTNLGLNLVQLLSAFGTNGTRT
jgi:hypothetical protein